MRQYSDASTKKKKLLEQVCLMSRGVLWRKLTFNSILISVMVKTASDTVLFEYS